MKTMHLRCYVRPIPGQWEAFCPEFDIVVNGRSSSEVLETIREAIAWHLEEAMSLAEPARSQLLNRRAPASTRFAYWLRYNLARLQRLAARNHGPTIREFDVPCPA